MNFYADRNYIHARVYALHGQLLAVEDYYDMARSGSFKSILPGVDSSNIKNNSQFIKEKIFEKHAGIVLSLADASGSSRRLFLLFLRYFESLNLKLLCAGAFGLAPVPSIWYDTGSPAVLHRGILPEITGFKAVIDITDNTWMEGIFKEGKVNSFADAELMIDRAVFRVMSEFYCSMKMRERKAFMNLAADFAEYIRLSWNSRLVKIYGMEQNDASGYMSSNILFPGPGAAIKRSARGLKYKLNKLYGQVNPGDSEQLAVLERYMERIIYRDTDRLFHENFHSINTLLCYLLLLYWQIRNLFSLVDGVRFGLSPELIMNQIVCEE